MSLTLVLASSSPARLATLRAAGIEPLVHVSDVDEDAALASANLHMQATAGRDLTPSETVALLAGLKAQAVATAVDVPAGTPVLGCDSMLEWGGKVWGKPLTPEAARERWNAIKGTSGVLYTGHHLLLAGSDAPAVHAVAATTVRFGSPSDREIDDYIATGEPLWVAGGFTIDGLGGAFIDSIEGDHHNVVGLSLPVLRGLLAQFGIGFTDLWLRDS